MEVKSVYMDLQEWVKKGNVWKLESEAFKKPIEIKIWYDNHDIKEFDSKIEELRELIKQQDKTTQRLEWEYATGKAMDTAFEQKIKIIEDNYHDQEKRLNLRYEEINSLYKVIADLKTTVETLSGTILHLQEQTSLIQKKITKVPMVFHDKWFISWRESSGLWMINIPDGDYLMIAKYVVWEHNEFVTNQNELLMDTIHVEGQHYIPFYKLEWGTELDTPTATIYYDLVFIPM